MTSSPIIMATSLVPSGGHSLFWQGIGQQTAGVLGQTRCCGSRQTACSSPLLFREIGQHSSRSPLPECTYSVSLLSIPSPHVLRAKKLTARKMMAEAFILATFSRLLEDNGSTATGSSAQLGGGSIAWLTKAFSRTHASKNLCWCIHPTFQPSNIPQRWMLQGGVRLKGVSSSASSSVSQMSISFCLHLAQKKTQFSLSLLQTIWLLSAVSASRVHDVADASHNHMFPLFDIVITSAVYLLAGEQAQCWKSCISKPELSCLS